MTRKDFTSVTIATRRLVCHFCGTSIDIPADVGPGNWMPSRNWQLGAASVNSESFWFCNASHREAWQKQELARESAA